jgi:two-component system response regulator PilR (NtrC family)
MQAILKYSWPGNVRELENAIEHAVAVSNERETSIHLNRLPDAVTGSAAPAETSLHIPEEGLDFESHIAQVERQYLAGALKAAGGVRTRAAELLRMSYRSFRHYAKKYGV